MSRSHVGKSKWRKSVYTPLNPEKYKGSAQIITRSQWEYRFCRFLDLNENIVAWVSEQPLVPYHNPNTNTTWNYHPDFVIQIKTPSGIKTQMIEIKPKKQTVPPVASSGKRKSTILHESMTWKMNCAKWEAAKIYCKQRGWEFKILTEDNIFA
jgi:hypothetical protein